jgi:hypothetical protein
LVAAALGAFFTAFLADLFAVAFVAAFFFAAGFFGAATFAAGLATALKSDRMSPRNLS